MVETTQSHQRAIADNSSRPSGEQFLPALQGAATAVVCGKIVADAWECTSAVGIRVMRRYGTADRYPIPELVPGSVVRKVLR